MDVLIDNGLANNGWLVERVNGLFNGVAREFERISPPVDVVEDHDSYRFSIDLPGLKSDALEVKVEAGTLVINAERGEPKWAKDARVHRSERHYGRIHRSLQPTADAGHGANKAWNQGRLREARI